MARNFDRPLWLPHFKNAIMKVGLQFIDITSANIILKAVSI